MRAYMAVIKDSFREAFASKILWVLIILITLFLLLLAGFSVNPAMRTSFERRDVIDMEVLALRLRDAEVHRRMLERLGKRCTVTAGAGGGDTLLIEEVSAPPGELLWEGRSIRNTLLIMGALCARTGHGAVPMPGGCDLGNRKYDLHVMLLERLGAKTEETAARLAAEAPKGGLTEIARFAADRLRADTRIAAWSINGFDTHSNQARQLPRTLADLSDNILALREALGPVWGKTAVVAMTEFGRTARANGTKGTDHGTGGAMLFAGGALRGGQVVRDWPGLAEADLYDRRDLMPTRDVRAHAGWMMRQLFGLEAGLIERTVFPGVELGPDPKLIL